MSTQAQVSSWRTTLQELGPRQQEIIERLRAEKGGLSAWELADLTGRLVHAVRPRLTELRALGVIRQVGERFEKRTERNEAVWNLVGEEDNGQLVFA